MLFRLVRAIQEPSQTTENISSYRPQAFHRRSPPFTFTLGAWNLFGTYFRVQRRRWQGRFGGFLAPDIDSVGRVSRVTDPVRKGRFSAAIDRFHDL